MTSHCHCSWKGAAREDDSDATGICSRKEGTRSCEPKKEKYCDMGVFSVDNKALFELQK